jgi:hypothetical protein
VLRQKEVLLRVVRIHQPEVTAHPQEVAAQGVAVVLEAAVVQAVVAHLRAQEVVEGKDRFHI